MMVKANGLMKKSTLLLTVLTTLLIGCGRNEPPAVEVPPLPDFAAINDVKEKKQAFFDYLLPLVNEANARILAEREVVEAWYMNSDGLSASQQQEIQGLLEKYRITTDNIDEQKDLLLRRVNTIPPSLVLAQAANESGWGTSRFAREANNFFGQWCYSSGCGLVPEARPDGAYHEVRAFDSPYESVESYMRNLNSHPSYRLLRELRYREVEQQGYSSGISLSAGLQSYSERGNAYIREIQQMIRINSLQRFDELPSDSDNQP